MEKQILYIGLAGMLMSPIAYVLNEAFGGFFFGVSVVFFIFNKGINKELESSSKNSSTSKKVNKK